MSDLGGNPKARYVRVVVYNILLSSCTSIYSAITGACASGPCQNNGTCTNTASGYTCNCTGTGYEGATCQTGNERILNITY